MSRHEDDSLPDSTALLDDEVDPGIAWAVLALWAFACVLYCWPSN